MKKIILGFIIGAVTAGTVSAFAAGKIKSAEHNEITVTYYNDKLELNNPLISVVDTETPDFFSNYMPVREILEKLGFNVEWDEESNNIRIATNLVKFFSNMRGTLDLGDVHFINLYPDHDLVYGSFTVGARWTDVFISVVHDDGEI